MIVVRDIFQLKFGKAREAVALWREGLVVLQEAGYNSEATRLLTDLVGSSYYTLVLESTFASLADYEQAAQSERADEAWKSWYARFVPLVESGRREILTLVA